MTGDDTGPAPGEGNYEVWQANRAIGSATATLTGIGLGVHRLTVAERCAYATAQATLAVAWLQLDAARPNPPRSACPCDGTGPCTCIDPACSCNDPRWARPAEDTNP